MICMVHPGTSQYDFTQIKADLVEELGWSVEYCISFQLLHHTEVQSKWIL